MPSNITKAQIEHIHVDPLRPLLVCDVDEVVVHFIKGLEAYLAELGLWLDPASFALNGNIKSLENNEPVSTKRVGEILTSFFSLKTHNLEPIDGAVSALNSLNEHMQIIMLSNLPHKAYEARIENLIKIGANFPLITNEGGKGPAVHTLSQELKSDLYFIDDIPHYLTSVRETCPQANLIHFAHDERFAKHAPALDFDHYRTRHWQDVFNYITTKLSQVPRSKEPL